MSSNWLWFLIVPVAGALYWWLFIRRRPLEHFRKGMIVEVAGQQRRVTKVDHKNSTITIDRPL